MDRLDRWTEQRGARVLRYAAVLYAVGTIIHTADHFRRGTDAVTKHVNYAGTALTILAFVTIALILTGHRLGPIAAVAVGLSHGFGIATAHLLPYWSAFSDAFTGSRTGPDITTLSWVAVLLEIGGALATGIAGAYLLRNAARRSSAPA